MKNRVKVRKAELVLLRDLYGHSIYGRLQTFSSDLLLSIGVWPYAHMFISLFNNEQQQSDASNYNNQ
jgi:hypothetical protein